MKCKCGKELKKILDTSDDVIRYHRAVDVYYCYHCGRVAIDKWVDTYSTEDPVTWHEHIHVFPDVSI